MNCLSLSAFKILWSWHVCVWISLILSYLEFTEFLGCLYSCLPLKLESFHTLFLQIYSLPFSLSLLSWDTHKSLKLCSLFFNLFFLFCRLNNFQVCWFFLLPAWIYLWIPLVNFSYQLLYFSAPEFLFGFFLDFPSLNWYLHFDHTWFSWFSPRLLLSLWDSLSLYLIDLPWYLFQEQFFFVYYFPLNGHTFLFPYIFCDFFFFGWNWTFEPNNMVILEGKG